MAETQDICPHCGGTEFGKGTQSGYGNVFRAKGVFGNGRKLNHLICLHCGTVVRSYVDEPEYFAE